MQGRSSRFRLSDSKLVSRLPLLAAQRSTVPHPRIHQKRTGQDKTKSPCNQSNRAEYPSSSKRPSIHASFVPRTSRSPSKHGTPRQQSDTHPPSRPAPKDSTPSNTHSSPRTANSSTASRDTCTSIPGPFSRAEPAAVGLVGSTSVAHIHQHLLLPGERSERERKKEGTGMGIKRTCCGGPGG